MSAVRHVVYLHGFASSPASSKAQRFAKELAARGVGFSCPDFNQPSFETLTVTRMLDQVSAALGQAAAGPVALVGSSLGAFVAVHAAARHAPTSATPPPFEPAGGVRADRPPPAAALGGVQGAPPLKIDRLILLAPALDFGGNRLRQLGDQGIEEWRRAGHLRVFHYAANEYRDIGFSLYEDAARYDAFALASTVPTLVFQGRRDESVDPKMVEHWAKGRPLINLRMVDDGHQLTESIELIWAESEKFLLAA